MSPSPSATRAVRRAALLSLGLTLASAPALAAQTRVPRLLGEPLLPRFEHLSRLGRMLMPVAGILPESLRDSFLEARSGGRSHEGIDIPAPKGTPVLAVSDGVVVGVRRGSIGGNAVHVLDPAEKRRYYYAHLDRFAPGLREGDAVSAGQLLGYVGDTGNAGRGNYHLHFAVIALSDLSRLWEGETLNPYALLREAEAR